VLKISAAKSELACPTCGLVAPRRMSAGGGLVFKGSGFYITDYGKDGKGPRKVESEKPAPEKSAESKGERGAAEAKPKPEPPSSKPATDKGGGKAPKE
jgi:predicted nucleic acid-binding Zn ribbon protein